MNEATKAAALAAAANLLAKKAGTVKPSAGDYHFDNMKVVVTLNGRANKAEDYERTPTASIPMIPVLCILLKKTGAVGNNCLNLIMEAMTEALEAGEKGDEYMQALMKEYAVAEEAVKAKLAKLPAVQAKGPFTVKDVEATFEIPVEV